MSHFRQDFIRFIIKQDVLCFGEYKTKGGRLSPYFSNAGLFNEGESLKQLTKFYAHAILFLKILFDMLYGPAYEGIPLAAGTAIALAEKDRNVPYCFNRKEAKGHNEGDSTVDGRSMKIGFSGTASHKSWSLVILGLEKYIPNYSHMYILERMKTVLDA